MQNMHGVFFCVREVYVPIHIACDVRYSKRTIRMEISSSSRVLFGATALVDHLPLGPVFNARFLGKKKK